MDVWGSGAVERRGEGEGGDEEDGEVGDLWSHSQLFA